MTDFLFAKPSFVAGAATVLDLFGVFHDYNRSGNERRADAWAMYHDFRTVGSDLEVVIQEYKDALKQLETEQQSHRKAIATV